MPTKTAENGNKPCLFKRLNFHFGAEKGRNRAEKRKTESRGAVLASRAAPLPALPQRRVLLLGFLENGDVRVGVLPQRQEILVGFAGFGGVAGEG